MAKQQPIRSIDGIARPVQKRSPFKRLKRSLQKSRSQQMVVALLAVALMVGGGIAISNLVKTPNYDDVSIVTSALAKHTILPDEEPILATVTDKSALKTPFLQESQNGDRIIIYPKAKKVIIYRPSVDRIVNIGPVDVDNIPKVN